MIRSLCILVVLLINSRADSARISQSVFDNKGIEMIFIPSGQFVMGATLNEALSFCETLYSESNRSVCSEIVFNALYSFDKVDSVTVEEFYMDKYEVSVEDYLMCVEADVCSLAPVENIYYSLLENPSLPTAIPVSGITYYDAAVYCAWRGGRLPSEAEWEYAAAGSNNNPFAWGDTINDLPANYCDQNCFNATDACSDPLRLDTMLNEVS
jgi:formylglycine-generating enzyme required for sulfatase activity